jgi:hypothetical protein
MIRPMCSLVGGGGFVKVAGRLGMGFSVISCPERLNGVEGTNRHKAIKTATKINPRGSRKPRGLVRREKIFRRGIILLILHPFDLSPGRSSAQVIEL